MLTFLKGSDGMVIQCSRLNHLENFPYMLYKYEVTFTSAYIRILFYDWLPSSRRTRLWGRVNCESVNCKILADFANKEFDMVHCVQRLMKCAY